MHLPTYLFKALLIVGVASQYGRGVAQRTIYTRQNVATAHSLPHTLPQTDGYVATADCDSIGSTVWLRPVGTIEWETFLVIDCASKRNGTHHDGRSSYDWMIRNNILVEIDYETAQRWNTIGRAIGVEMRHAPQPLYEREWH